MNTKPVEVLSEFAKQLGSLAAAAGIPASQLYTIRDDTRQTLNRVSPENIEAAKRSTVLSELLAENGHPVVDVKPSRTIHRCWACLVDVLHVNNELGYYHCFKCGESGDAISFLKDTYGITFTEAANMLIKRAGVAK